MSEAADSKHTNEQWYPFPDLGSYFRIDEGQLLQLPMLIDGTRGSEEEVAEVDWYNIAESDRARLQAIQEELLAKA